MAEKWRVQLGGEAERDFGRILQRTLETFGPRQFDIYALTLRAALTALEDGPDILGSVNRDEILPSLRSLHVARKKRRGRHIIVYRARTGQLIEVIRILHEAMDLARHLPDPTDLHEG